MIVMRIKGGLGNQLFQYSAAYALSKRLNQPLRFDPSFTFTMTARGYKLPDLLVDEYDVVEYSQLPFKIRIIKNAYINKICRVLNVSKHKCRDYCYWIETKDEWQSDFFRINASNIYVDGYFQSEKYFKQYRQELIRQFKPRYCPEKSYLRLLDLIKRSNSIAVHIRRGDFKKDNNPFHYILHADYYISAIQYMKKNVEKPLFFFFSDDQEWISEHIGFSENYVFVNFKTEHGDIDDLMLMSNCRHIITANSTFSWWAAWLNEYEDVIRIVPRKPYGMEGMIPKGWIKL